MKKVCILILSLLLVLGVAGCALLPQPSMPPEVDEGEQGEEIIPPIEVAEEAVVEEELEELDTPTPDFLEYELEQEGEIESKEYAPEIPSSPFDINASWFFQSPDDGWLHFFSSGDFTEFGLNSERAQEFFSEIDLSGLTPAQGNFDDIGLNNPFRPGIRLIASGWEHQLILDRDANIAHYVRDERYNYNGEIRFRRSSELFFYMPPGFYDFFLSRAVEFHQYDVIER